MTITQLKYVLAVAKYKNFTLAAEKSFVTQPTLSMQIQKLEEELNVQLFNRSKKPIGLTAVGEKIVEQAQIIVTESNRIQDIVEQEKGFIGGEFRLGIIPTVMPTLLPIFLKNVTEKYPEIQLIIEESPTGEILERIKDGKIDAAIAATPLADEEIIEKPLYYEPFYGFIPKGHELSDKKLLSIDDLDINDILLLQDGHCFKNSVLNMCNKSQFIKDNKGFMIQSGNFETLIKLTKEGLGMTLLPYLNTLDLSIEDKKLLYAFEKPVPSREISFIYHKKQLKLQIIKALKKSIDGLIKGAIAFTDVEIISPIAKDQ